MSKLNVIKLNDEQLDVLAKALVATELCLDLMGADELTGFDELAGKDHILREAIALVINANDVNNA